MSKTILIVEDNDLNIKLFNDLLQAHGYDTVQTMDGRDVLKLAREHCPNLILMDMNFPGLEHIEALHPLRASDETEDIHVLALTATAVPGEVENGKNADFEKYLTKPTHVPHLLAIISAYLNA